jgi:hypothetical protein
MSCLDSRKLVVWLASHMDLLTVAKATAADWLSFEQAEGRDGYSCLHLAVMSAHQNENSGTCCLYWPCSIYLNILLNSC